MFDWVASLCDLIRYNHGDLDFTVIPSGSFPWNVKVENLDEFDYVSALENKAFAIEDKTNLYWPFDGHQISKTKLTGSALLDVLKLVLSKSVKNGNLLGIDLMEKTNAININFSWLCSSNHTHLASIDLAISIKTSITIQEYFSSVKSALKGTPFEDSIDINEKMYWNCAFRSGTSRANTNIFDKQVFETCDEISPNIRLCYRAFKFIGDCFFPLSFGESWCCFLGSYKNCLKVCFSSYSLKKVLFQDVIEFPSSDLWKNDFIQLRIASMLQIFSKYDPDQDIFDNRSEGNRLRHVKNKGVWQSHTSSRNTESIGV